MKKKIDFVRGSTQKCLISMVLPLLMAMILTMAYNLVDSLWVGNLLGEQGYAALTSSTAVVLILSAISMGASNGASILISHAVGAKQQEEAERSIATMLILAAAFSAAVTVVLELLLKRILLVMGTPAELYDMAYSYLSVYLLGYAFIHLYMHVTAVFRSYGDPVFQMKGMLITTIFNAVLDPILISSMGLRGAAWATVLSEVLCLVFAAAYHHRKKMFRLDFRCASAACIRPLLADIVPSAMQSCMPAVSSAAMLILVTGFGVATIAAYGVTNKLEILLFYPAMAMNMGLTAIVGQCIGAKRLDRAKDYVHSALLIGGLFLAGATALVIIFARPLTGLFLYSTEGAAIVQNFFRIVSIGYVMYLFTSCFLGELSGLGKPGMSMILFFIYYIVIRIPLANILVRTALGLNGIWTAILVSHIAAAALALVQTKLLEKKLDGKYPQPGNKICMEESV